MTNGGVPEPVRAVMAAMDSLRESLSVVVPELPGVLGAYAAQMPAEVHDQARQVSVSADECAAALGQLEARLLGLHTRLEVLNLELGGSNG